MGYLEATAKANANTGILRYAQNDEQTKTKTKTEADPYGMTTRKASNCNCEGDGKAVDGFVFGEIPSKTHGKDTYQNRDSFNEPIS